MKKELIIYWSRRDFRLCDNPALSEAMKVSAERNVPLLPLFILEDYMCADDPEFQYGYPSRFFLSRALPHFARRFPQFLVLRGKGARNIVALTREYDITVYVNDDIHPDFYSQVRKLEMAGISIVVLPDALTVSKETRTGQGNIYSVFTPFKNAVWTSFVSKKPLPPPDIETIITLPPREFQSLQGIHPTSESLKDLFKTSRTLMVGPYRIDLVPLVDYPDLELWYTDEEGARKVFAQFLESGSLETYKQGRDSLHADAESVRGRTSRMSVALAWGLTSPRILVYEIQKRGARIDDPTLFSVNESVVSYISELIWREFYRYLFFHNPGLMNIEFQEKFRGKIRWEEDSVAYDRFVRWIQGETGYPVVDAGMRQLKSMGWMHNRARMIVASVLTKNLGVDWRWGQEYFRSALIDLDEASNNGGWQWGASVGADPKPIRIFNPELQAKNYDGDGVYQARWHGESEEGVLKHEVVPIVEHKRAREEALKRYGLTGKITPRDY